MHFSKSLDCSSLPIRSSFVYKGRLYVQLKERERESWGEIAPLSGWSEESLDEVERQLKGELPISAPSVIFGLLCALNGLQDHPPSPPPIPVAAYLEGTVDEIALLAEKAIENGFTTAKMKISHLCKKDLSHLLKLFHRHLALRLDLNRAWNLEEALSFFSHFSQDAFDYIEEPLINPHELSFFTHPFALDESLREGFYCDHPLLKALVIKPSLHRNWQEWLSSHQQIIFGSSYESDFGLAQIALMAYRANAIAHPLGIGTYVRLTETLLETPLKFSQGHLHLPETLQLKKEVLNAAQLLDR
jgi:O-succinylbenzoate synthase